MKIVIIGGVAGGASAAARLRRLNENAEIIIIERSGYISYANCGLPYYIGGIIKKESSLTLQTPKSFFKRFNIDARIKEEALQIDRTAKKVIIKKLATGEIYEESYDKLILAPGAIPRSPTFKGSNREGIFSLRTVEDSFAIKNFITETKPREATIIGGGFIAIEMAENLASLGIEVTLIQRSSHILSQMDADMATILHKNLTDNGIHLLLNTQINRIEKDDNDLFTFLEDGTSVVSQMIILAMGVIPENNLALEANLNVAENGGIIVDKSMKTNDDNIYAVGDAVNVEHFITNKKVLINLAGPANREGRIAADNIMGLNSVYTGAQGSFILKHFDMTVASTGLSYERAISAGIDADYVQLSSPSHASYYPNGANMHLRVVFEKESGAILGGQIIGYDGVDKRIDVLATAIRAEMTCFDLTELDLAYAPPFSSAKDPINMAGYVIENLVTGLVRQIHFDDLKKLSSNIIVLDTRTDKEYMGGHYEGAMHIPLDDLRGRIDEIPKDKPIFVYCHSGLRSYIATRILLQNGYNAFNISGGFGFYQLTREKLSFKNEETLPCGIKKE